jgi:hypothetical protein
MFQLVLYLALSALAIARMHAVSLDGDEKKYKLAVCAVFQNENFFMQEWLEFHKLMGVEHFYLYDNNSTDNSLEILKPYIESGIVDLFEWPVETNNEHEYLHLLQLPVYNHALQIAKHEASWIAFIDLDEFLFPVVHQDLITFLQDHQQRAGLAVNWQLYGTSWLETVESDKLITESLLLKAPTDHNRNQIVKMIVQPQYVHSIENPHFFKFCHGYYATDSAGRKIPHGAIGQPVNINAIRINHYWCGTNAWLMTQKVPRRQKWGLAFPPSLLSSIVTEYNHIYDDSITRFVPQLKRALESNVTQ